MWISLWITLRARSGAEFFRDNSLSPNKHLTGDSRGGLWNRITWITPVYGINSYPRYPQLTRIKGIQRPRHVVRQTILCPAPTQTELQGIKAEAGIYPR